MATNYVGGDISVAPFLQGVTNILIANQQKAEQAAQAEQERADRLYSDISKEANKINPDGVRNADLPIFTEVYNTSVKTPMIEAQIARSKGDMKTYAEKLAEVNAGVNELRSFVATSKQEGKNDLELIKSIGDNPERYGDNIRGVLQKRINTPTRNLSGELKYGSDTWFRRIDTSKVQGEIDKTLKDLLSSSGKQIDPKVGRLNIGGRGSDVVTFRRELSKDVFSEAMTARFAGDPVWMEYARINELGDTPEEAALNLTAAYEQAGRFVQERETQQVVRDQAPRQPGSGSSTERLETYRQQHIQGIMAGEEWAIADLRGSVPSGINGEPARIEYDGNKITIKTPISITGTEIKYNTSEVIDLNDPAAWAQLNRILNNATGQTVSLGVSRIEGGRPRGPLVDTSPGRGTLPEGGEVR